MSSRVLPGLRFSLLAPVLGYLVRQRVASLTAPLERQRDMTGPSRSRRWLVAPAVGVGVALGGATAYRVLFRRRILDWGARPDEAVRRLPGDEFLEAADVVATRAITIDAPPSAIWPWLIQMGPGRGGVYTYDWIENLFGLDMHSADEIVPEWQSMEVGYVWRNPQGKGMCVETVEPERAMVMRAEDGGWVWAFVLVPEGDRTRFLSRNRFRQSGNALGRLATTYLMEPGSLIMERKMLLGIKGRAERLARERAVTAAPVAATQPAPVVAAEADPTPTRALAGAAA